MCDFDCVKKFCDHNEFIRVSFLADARINLPTRLCLWSGDSGVFWMDLPNRFRTWEGTVHVRPPTKISLRVQHSCFGQLTNGLSSVVTGGILFILQVRHRLFSV